MDITTSVNTILDYKEKIDADPDNHYYIFPFIALVLNLTDEKGFVSDKGLQMLRIPIANDFQIVNEDPHNPSQKALTRISLYFALIHNLMIFFTGFISILESDQGSLYADKLPADLVDYLKDLFKRIAPYSAVCKAQLEHILPKLTDKYAYLFSQVKHTHFVKPVYQEDVVRIPTHEDDLPEGFSRKNCINVNDLNR